MKSRFLALLFIFSMLLTVSLSVSAATTDAPSDSPPSVIAPDREEDALHIKSTIDGILYSVKDDGTVMIEGCRTTAINLTVPAEIDGMAVTEIAAGAFAGNAGLMGIALPDSITVIGERAFGRCENLTAAILPTGLQSIPAQCFAECRALKRVTLPTSLTKIGERAFYQCTTLGKITVPEGVSEIGEESFYGCEQLFLSCKDNAYVKAYAAKHRIPQSFFETSTAQILTIVLASAVVLILLIPIRRVIQKKRKAKV